MKNKEVTWYRLRDKYGIEFWAFRPMVDCEILYTTTEYPFNPIKPVE
jgi:hypothetical protein